MYIYVIIDETWLHDFTPQSNWQSSEWTARDRPNRKHEKMQNPTGKVMVSNITDSVERGKKQQLILYRVNGTFGGLNLGEPFVEEEIVVPPRYCNRSEIKLGINFGINIFSRFVLQTLCLFSKLKRMVTGKQSLFWMQL